MTLFNKLFGLFKKSSIKQTKRSETPIREKHQRLTSAEIKEIRKLKREGKTPTEITKLTGISDRVISYHTKVAKYIPVSKKPVEARITQLRKRHDKHIPSYHDKCPCGIITGIPQNLETLENYLKHAGLEKTNRIKLNRVEFLAKKKADEEKKKTVHFVPEDKTLLTEIPKESTQFDIPTRKELLQRDN